MRYDQTTAPTGLPIDFDDVLTHLGVVDELEFTAVREDILTAMAVIEKRTGRQLLTAAVANAGGTIFCYRVRDAQRYGVAELDGAGRVIGIEEKPAAPKSSYAVTGLYFFDNRVLDVAAGLRPSARGELEITDVNNWYLRQGALRAILLGRGTAWLDTGTTEALLQASNFIEAVQSRQGLMIACIEEIAWRLGYLDRTELRRLACDYGRSNYGDYLRALADSEEHP